MTEISIMVKRIVRRDSRTGRFCTEKYVRSHPSTTEVETVQVPYPPREKKSVPDQQA